MTFPVSSQARSSSILSEPENLIARLNSRQDFEKLTALWWEKLAESSELASSGLTERNTQRGFLTWTAHLEQGLMASRWNPSEKLFSGRDLVDLFCCWSPAEGKNPEQGWAGVRIWKVGSGARQLGLQDLLLLWPELEPYGWRQAKKPLPSFSEFSALLQSVGSLNSSSHEVWQQSVQLQGEVQQLKAKLAEVEAERDELAARVKSFSSLVWLPSDVVKPGAAESGSPKTEDKSTWPQTWDKMEEWLIQYEGQLTVTARALNAVKKAQYEKPEYAYRGLHFLATAYRDARLGKISQEAMETALQATGLKIAGSTVPSIAGEQGDAYFVNWNKRKRYLELHLLKGGGREERYCLRIYFFWDADTEQCVVGWLPSHLPNSLS